MNIALPYESCPVSLCVFRAPLHKDKIQFPVPGIGYVMEVTAKNREDHSASEGESIFLHLFHGSK
jgi:hypothetical protein